MKWHKRDKMKSLFFHRPRSFCACVCCLTLIGSWAQRVKHFLIFVHRVCALVARQLMNLYQVLIGAGKWEEKQNEWNECVSPQSGDSVCARFAYFFSRCHNNESISPLETKKSEIFVDSRVCRGTASLPSICRAKHKIRCVLSVRTALAHLPHYPLAGSG